MPTPKLLDQLRAALRARHRSRRTEEAYVGWVRRFVRFHRLRHPARMGAEEINRFLTHLAVVLTRDEVKRVFARLHGDPHTVCLLQSVAAFA